MIDHGLTQLVRAKHIAVIAHATQLSKQGEPYIEHVQRVVDRVTSPVARVVAWLHDVLEDNPNWTAWDLKCYGIQPEAVEAVEILTKRQGEAYPAYIDRVVHTGNYLVWAVKLADLYDHLVELDRWKDHKMTPHELRPRYVDALRRIRPLVLPGSVVEP